MHYAQYFSPYTVKIDNFLEEFFQNKRQEAEKKTPVAADMWMRFQEFIAGGKRVRGGLVKLGYECFGQVDENKLLPVSSSIEILHSALLVHDDIIDQSFFRHGRPTIHKQYEAFHKNNYQKGISSRYGENMGIIVGILAYFETIALINKAQFLPEFKVKAVSELCSFAQETGYGEGLDVDLAQRGEISEKEVLKVYDLKTAQYTFVGPLKIGGILAGANEKQLEHFEDYGMPVGIAFQLQDDILGMFGFQEKTGKPVDDDIKEGKNTLLYTQALKNGTKGQQKRLKSLWGKKNITQKELREAQEIIKETGSLSYSQELAQELVAKGKKAVPKLTQDKSLQEVFLTLADFVVQREK